MNFLEAVKAMKEGKKVNRGNSSHMLSIRDNNLKCSKCNRIVWELEAFEAIDWEIVEERKTLSDEIYAISKFGSAGQENKDYKVDIWHLKEALKKFLDWNESFSNAELIKEKLKEIFGERLIE